VGSTWKSLNQDHF